LTTPRHYYRHIKEEKKFTLDPQLLANFNRYHHLLVLFSNFLALTMSLFKTPFLESVRIARRVLDHDDTFAQMFLTGNHAHSFKIVLADNIKLYSQAVMLEMLYFQTELEVQEKKSQVVQTCFGTLVERFVPDFHDHIKKYLDNYHPVVATPLSSPALSTMALSPPQQPLNLVYPPSSTPVPERSPSVEQQWPYSPTLPDALVMQGVKFCRVCKTHDHDGYSCPSFMCDSCQRIAPGHP
jgi:hypothetical protein